MMEKSVVTAASQGHKRSASNKRLMPYHPNATRNRPKHAVRCLRLRYSTIIEYRSNFNAVGASACDRGTQRMGLKMSTQFNIVALLKMRSLSADLC